MDGFGESGSWEGGDDGSSFELNEVPALAGVVVFLSFFLILCFQSQAKISPEDVLLI